MSKSEYKRLEVQMPDVVKTIREHVINECAKICFNADKSEHPTDLGLKILDKI